MSTNDPDQIRADIARTRAELSADVDALGDKVSPGQIAQRQKDRVRSTATAVKERVMGTAHGAGDSVSSRASSAGEAVGDIPGTLRRQAEGNPLAAGLIAFGVGWLASSLIPSSQKEQEASVHLREKASGLADEVKQVASDVAQDLQEPLQGAAHAVQERAQTAAAELKEEGAATAHGVQHDAQAATENIQGSRAGS
ncbi:DUF3618 domain-containing protein [Actinotalea sp. K2]|uniref:DUF3618 domain-containing protein n=1 Tax=Actinotalea sp. K2 TaxID=2939438 RepID=UPI0020171164|nr:DUF3618 domain-containing protein [Actinotalea sp. K2]MCL3862384.1 DUF3618 domain-containing protein [Actinotalea sp. K2]